MNTELDLPGHRGIVRDDLRTACTCGWIDSRTHPTRAAAQEAWFRDHGLPASEAVPPQWLLVKSDVLREQVADMIRTRPETALRLLAEIDAWHRPLTEQAVVAAKAAGASWSDVGSALGVSRQAAHERFRALTP